MSLLVALLVILFLALLFPGIFAGIPLLWVIALIVLAVILVGFLFRHSGTTAGPWYGRGWYGRRW